MIKLFNYIRAKRAFKKMYTDMTTGVEEFDILKLSSTISKVEPKNQVWLLIENGLNQRQIEFVMLSANDGITLNEIDKILRK